MKIKKTRRSFKTFIKDLFCSKEEYDTELGSYARMLGLNRNLKFSLSIDKVADQTEFDKAVVEAKTNLIKDFIRLGEEEVEFIDSKLRNRVFGVVGCMKIYAGDDGKLTTYFHRRDENGIWDGNDTKFPKSNSLTKKYYSEVFFIFGDDE